MNYREYEKLKADAISEYRRKFEAIETVWKMSGGLVPQSNSNGTPKSQIDSIDKGSLQQAARQAVSHLVGVFTHRHVYQQILANDPNFAEKIKDKMPSLSGTLKRLADDNELILVEAGRGKRASTYRRPG